MAAPPKTPPRRLLCGPASLRACRPIVTRRTHRLLAEQGVVGIFDENGEHIVDLKEGSVLGEMCLLKQDARRTATIKAQTWCGSH